jgi:uncharacterized membrane protein
MPTLTLFVQRILELMKRYPGVIALGGFISGVGSFMLVDRQQGLATWITTIMLVSWIWLMLENSLTKLFARVFKREIPQPLLRYATQMIHQESLFFVLPFFLITTTWNSGQLFAALLTALPVILHLTTAQSFKLALGIAMLLSFPSLASIFPIRTVRNALAILSITVGIGAAGWVLRSWVPPATLWMTDVAISTQMQDRTPGKSLEEVSAEQIRGGGLYAYTAINAPRGLAERIYHVWMFNGKEVDRIPLDINGGRKEGYRAWTHKQNFPGNPAGKWQVRVLTEDGQLIGVLRFKVMDSTPIKEK